MGRRLERPSAGVPATTKVDGLLGSSSAGVLARSWVADYPALAPEMERGLAPRLSVLKTGICSAGGPLGHGPESMWAPKSLGQLMARTSMGRATATAKALLLEGCRSELPSEPSLQVLMSAARWLALLWP